MTLDSSASAVIARVAGRIATAPPDRFLGLLLPDYFDPVRILQGAWHADTIASYEHPSTGLALVAIGEVRRVDLRRREGPGAARGAVRRALAVRADVEHADLVPRMLGGFRFNPAGAPARPWEVFGVGRLTLPRMLFIADRGMRGVVLAPGVDVAELAPLLEEGLAAPERDLPGTNGLRVARPIDEASWCESVRQIAEEVRAGVYEKAVLATTLELAGERAVETDAALERLRAWYPECHIFSIRADGAVFLGASPEMLVGLRDGRVHTLGLAGSTGRGVDEAEDERLGRALMASAKDRIEHETVVRAIRERLEGVTEGLRAPNVPELRRLRNIQHLSTEIVARARPGVDVLELVRRLHPTPAVCGWPRDTALQVIGEHEAFDRGWYAGPVGWLDGRGHGEFAVALRSALVRGAHAWLFGGNGIMGDSDPASELAEVRLKFRPLMEALGGRPPAA